ncbi:MULTISPECIES: hypothetical protein [unclassified Proteus (in: enterobacteria)]|uniref:hypothetical protein n=1 Tax=unclassified Proteus (in: enterobacteria) TaxID=257482 RepID=UPI0032DA81A7
MYKKHILALSGTSNSGKTTTIKVIHKKLLKHFEGHCIETNYLSKRATTEILRIIQIDEFKIGIVSKGDPMDISDPTCLKNSLAFLMKKGCHLIICACRTKGKTVEYILECKPKYASIFYDKNKEATELKEDKWKEVANKVFDKTICFYKKFVEENNKLKN